MQSVSQPVLPFAQGDWRVEPRGTVGATLAEARMRRSMTLEDVAAETRVPIRYLTAIEADRLDVIPGRVYARGFAKAFARTVGVCESWAGDAIIAALGERRVLVAA